MIKRRPIFMSPLQKAAWLYKNQDQVNEYDKKFLAWYFSQRGNFGASACSEKFK